MRRTMRSRALVLAPGAAALAVDRNCLGVTGAKEDGGDTSDMDSWYTEGDVDFAPIAERLFEDVIAPHRPE